MPPTGLVLAAALSSALLMGVECGFGDDGTLSPPDPIAPKSATPAITPGSLTGTGRQRSTHGAATGSAHPASLRTGIPAIDAVVRAVAAHDAGPFPAPLVEKVFLPPPEGMPALEEGS